VNVILLIVVLLLVFGGGGGYYASRSFGAPGVGGVLMLVLVIFLVIWALRGGI